MNVQKEISIKDCMRQDIFQIVKCDIKIDRDSAVVSTCPCLSDSYEPSEKSGRKTALEMLPVLQSLQRGNKFPYKRLALCFNTG